MSTTKLETIQKHAVPATRVLRAVPMPPFAHRRGAIPMHPPDAAVSALFSRAVTTVEVRHPPPRAPCRWPGAAFAPPSRAGANRRRATQEDGTRAWQPAARVLAPALSRGGSGAAQVGTEDELTTLMSVSGMMAPFYAQMSTAHKSLPN